VRQRLQRHTVVEQHDIADIVDDSAVDHRADGNDHRRRHRRSHCAASSRCAVTAGDPGAARDSVTPRDPIAARHPADSGDSAAMTFA
jgi:hypothetical protein